MRRHRPYSLSRLSSGLWGVDHELIHLNCGRRLNVYPWRFLKLEEQTLTIDLTDYPLPPVEQILSLEFSVANVQRRAIALILH